MQKFRSVRWTGLVVVALLGAAAEAGGSRLHVRAGAPAIGADGLSWATAFPTLQPALDIARAAPQDVTEIWVAQGVYKPTVPYTGPGQGNPADSRSRAFLTAGPDIPVYGGFKGDETTLPPITQRRYPTILSGDHLGNDNFSSPAGTTNTADNSYHVVRVTNGGCWFNGVTIRSGVANSLTNSFDRNGGGLRSTNFNMDVVRLERCRVTYNFATDDGGGLCNNANAYLEGCVFDRNRTNAGGGGIRHFGSSLVVVNSVFRQNEANSISNAGGAALVTTFSTFTNCTLIENDSVGSGGALRAGTGGTLRIANCLLWNNSSPPVFGTNTITNSWVQGINPDPRLLDTSGPDGVHFTDDDYPFGIVAIDAPIRDLGANGADIDQSSGALDPLPSTDARGLPRLDASTGLVDIGAYEVRSIGELVYRTSGGSFEGSSNWLGGVEPGATHAAVFDRDLTISFDSGSVQNQRLEVYGASVELRLLNAAAYVMPVQPDPGEPGVIVDRGALLRVKTYAFLPDPFAATLSSHAISVGRESRGEIIVDGFGSLSAEFVRLFGDEDDLGNPASIVISQDTTFTVDRWLSVGADAGGNGSVRFNGGIGEIGLPLEDAHIRVGDYGRGEMRLDDAAELYASKAILCVGCEAGSIGHIDITGGSVVYLDDPTTLDIGLHGDATLSVSHVGELNVGAGAPLRVAAEPGSVASVSLDQGGRITALDEVHIGAAGGGDATVTLGVNAVVEAPVVRIAPGGKLLGDGLIDGDLFNGGRVAPRDANGQVQFGALEISGNYEQFRDPQAPSELSGRLEMDIGSTPAEFDALDIGGVATLGGGLYLAAPDGPPAAGSSFQIVRGAGRIGAFDVISSPVFDNRYFFRAVYRDGGQRGAMAPIVEIVLDALEVVAEFDTEQTVDLQTTSGEPLAGAAADLNGDGFTDLAVIIPALMPLDPGCVLVLMNAGVDGMGEWLGFEEFASCVSVGLDPRAIVALNTDGDNDTDVAVANFGSGSVTVLRNNGAGDFAASPPLILPAPGAPVDIAATDMDLDGAADLIVASALADAILVYHSNGAGGFGLAQLAPIGAPPTAIVVDQLVPGGGPDVAIASASAGVVIVLSNDGARSLTGAASIPLGGGDPDDIDSGDLDNDKDVDIVAAITQPEPGNLEAGVVAVIIADSAAPNGFRPPAFLAIGDAPRAMTIAQLDSAGGPDIAVIAEVAGDAAVQLLVNTTLPGGSASFSEPSMLSTSGSPRFLVSADVDNDSDEDLVTLNGTGGMEARGAADISTLLNELTIAVPGDVNFDGVVDFADLNIVLSAFNTTGFGSPADVNDDGFIGFADLNFVLSSFNTR